MQHRLEVIQKYMRTIALMTLTQEDVIATEINKGQWDGEKTDKIKQDISLIKSFIDNIEYAVKKIEEQE